ncbi:MAG: PIN domain-containing protein [Ilumatobacteraceae bacterium]|nr:PIN domain-containing protein [Ilumatobacteraceae bacterium]
MSLLLLDTTLLVDAERGAADLDALIADDDDVAMAAITLAELTVGIHLATPRQRPRRETYVDAVVKAVPILPYDDVVARHHAVLLAAVRQSGRRRGAHDLIIAATAAATRRMVVSSDRRAFDDLPGVTAVDHRGGSTAP